MIATRYAWEDTLNSLAIQTERVPEHGGRPAISDRDLLRRAYAHCTAITKKNSHTFFLASRFLPHPKREGICALYSFCRRIDDTVDAIESTPASAEARLDTWRAMASSVAPPASAPVAIAWADTRARFAIPVRYADQLINGVAADLSRHRYQTFDELAAYAYGVASTVGLMSMHVIGYSGDEAIPYAVKLGVALQVTNILRDVGEDFQAGRIYLPLDELRAFGLSEADLATECMDDRWRAFMRFQIARNRRLYH
ncbi:MAG TPA: phytoene/squalene synthase family protein, partial [Ktedonobacterales bacterium]